MLLAGGREADEQHPARALKVRLVNGCRSSREAQLWQCQLVEISTSKEHQARPQGRGPQVALT